MKYEEVLVNFPVIYIEASCPPGEFPKGIVFQLTYYPAVEFLHSERDQQITEVSSYYLPLHENGLRESLRECKTVSEAISQLVGLSPFLPAEKCYITYPAHWVLMAAIGD